MVRPPAVAGRFYPNQAEELSRQVASFCAPPPGETRRRAVACLVPHAGYRFSGHVAGAVYARLELPRRFLLIGPRHYPRGQAQAILSEGAWQTPLGRAEIDAALASELKRACGGLVEDDVAHRSEHALEVQLPFLQKLAGEFRFVPIALGALDFAALESLGKAMAQITTSPTKSRGARTGWLWNGCWRSTRTPCTKPCAGKASACAATGRQSACS